MDKIQVNILPRRLVAGSGETPPSETVNAAANARLRLERIAGW